MTKDLLPFGTTSTAESIARMLDSHGRYAHHIDKIKHIGVTFTPEDWVPWLIWDYGLEEVVPYVRDMQRVLAEGPEWQRTRGTDRAFEIAFTWLNSEGYIDAPDGRHMWWEYQLGFTQSPSDLEQLKQLVGLSRLSQAAEGELFRIFSEDFDHRPVRMDEHCYDDGLFDGYSGLKMWEGSPLISVGVSQAHVMGEGHLAPVTGTLLSFATVLEADKGLRYDEAIFDDHPEQVVIALHSSTLTSGSVLSYEVSGWPDWWPDDWSEVAKPHLIATRPDIFE